ncbi:MAG: phosphatidylserine decarboxylase family protein [Candidatus Jettenia sp.]|uniref:Phosphatidylserine decarboxylase proenzyme n=1 Tax=Candidatus Jettenia caeni TaxID=247490 RepID=I3IQ42_9BACT|nr:phosphatidylserine decarboxylase family protein [Candidatus Jettenia sp. AMX1]MBC6929535.1 phosphatidylserine decarboxylase family protein [Candidatus Jettenia sp.]NUN22929.1 phosphatidylserine decarboxylase family protein [Candidatus Jettenia caeni]KAA0247698.1 MAG: phosphatidylserine decarboxylase family protein [Candidatus Jettenia sp. AMX1]MCE7881158.1 phosphatidylserine decarboxylase family protein [Candidatus Jettenia sp. AMX1]MCQ3927898.1 phosphatidylserine decarboxylase family prote
MRIPLAKYGLRELIIFGVSCIVGIGFSLMVFPWMIPVPVFILMFLLNFFRDPDREVPQGTGLIISPADGIVSHIVPVFEDNYLQCNTTKISIFMSVLNVHVNRIPVHGRVEFIKHTKGKFLDARDDECFRSNENNVMGLSLPGSHVKIAVKQIAGKIAKRIVCACKIGDVLRQGQRFGMIKFGSRVEVFIPDSVTFEIRVKVGEKVTAGKTVLGKIHDRSLMEL